MSTDTSFTERSQQENWLPILELSTREVFSIMLDSTLEPAAGLEQKPPTEFTAMVGLAGSLCGLLTISCSARTANQIAARMLGIDAENPGEQVWDALGELCNMVAGNFESGSATMKPESEPAFDRIAVLLRDRGFRIRIEGHTDNVPIHTARFSSNWELSTARATEVIRLLIVRDGFNPNYLSAAGYAEFHPVASNQTEEGRGANRRVDIIVLGLTAAADPGVPVVDKNQPSQRPRS
jgi:outer membrane protein OmpA-like peptidoglycan-associated protein